VSIGYQQRRIVARREYRLTNSPDSINKETRDSSESLLGEEKTDITTDAMFGVSLVSICRGISRFVPSR